MTMGTVSVLCLVLLLRSCDTLSEVKLIANEDANQGNYTVATDVPTASSLGVATFARKLDSRANNAETSWKQKDKRESKSSIEVDSVVKTAKTSRKRLKAKADKRLRLGLFMDEAAYRKLTPFFEGDDERIVQLLVGIVNQIQAVFFQEFLGIRLALNVVHLEILKTQPTTLAFANGEAFHVLTTFCDYQKRRNNISEEHPSHWDMALYFTGIDLYTENKQKRSYSSMGLSVIDGICKPSHSCVIGELGVTSVTSRPYLSSGFMSAFIMAHEMGHSMGMLHDGYGNDCPKDGFLMSASRGISGETVWSNCSAAILRESKATCLKIPDVNEYKMYELDTLPGQVWDADDQCRLFLKDDDARQVGTNTTDLCPSLKCLSSDKINSYAAGPALDGTYCGPKKWCRNGECTAWKFGYQKPLSIAKGGWSKWNSTSCLSGCLEKSVGIVRRSRKCNNPKPSNGKSCYGKKIRIAFCDDEKICSEKKSMINYATEKCQKISKLLPELTSEGNQMPYNEKRIWQSCAIYCRTKEGLWQTPRFDLHGNLTDDTHFPDGSRCHHDVTRDATYYCMDHECVEGKQQIEPRKPLTLNGKP